MLSVKSIFIPFHQCPPTMAERPVLTFVVPYVDADATICNEQRVAIRYYHLKGSWKIQVTNIIFGKESHVQELF